MLYCVLLLYHQNYFENFLTQRVLLLINLYTTFKYQCNNQQQEAVRNTNLTVQGFLHLNKMSFNKVEYLSLLHSYFVPRLHDLSDTRS
jgi:hypothetical protein